MQEDELGFEYISRYLALKKYNLMGTIWECGPVCMLTPVIQFQRREFAGPVPIERIKELIDYWYPRIKEPLPVIERIGVGSERRLLVKRRYY